MSGGFPPPEHAGLSQNTDPTSHVGHPLNVLVMTPKGQTTSKIELIIIHTVLLSMEAEMVEWWVLPLQFLFPCCPVTVMTP